MGVRMVAISPDTVEEAAKMKRKLGLGFTLLSDPSLAVIDLYGLRHDKGLAAAPGRKIMRPLAIPTTFVVDADGIIRWIDQAEDYRVRSDAGRVLEAVTESLDASGHAA